MRRLLHTFELPKAQRRSGLNHIHQLAFTTSRLESGSKTARLDRHTISRVIVTTLWNKLFTTAKLRLSTGKYAVSRQVKFRVHFRDRVGSTEDSSPEARGCTLSSHTTPLRIVYAYCAQDSLAMESNSR
jgi:hypothetical protein